MKPSLLLVSALAFGGVAAFGFSQWSAGVQRGGPLIAVAVESIEAGVALQAGQIRMQAWPDRPLPAGVFSEPGRLVGRVARERILAGDPVREARLAPQDAKGGLGALIAPGKRAITVRVNEVVAVAGFLLPGSLVDVLVATKTGDGGAFSKIVLDRVKVLAVAQETSSDGSKPKVVNAVTLELAPADAEQLDLARTVGTLSLAMRNATDQAHAVSRGARLNDLQTPSTQVEPSRTGRPPAESISRKPGGRPAGAVVTVEELRGLRSSEATP